MKLDNGAISILVGEKTTTVELVDRDAGITFAKVTLTPAQFCQALSRTVRIDCESVEVFGLDCVGKELEHKKFEFMIDTTVTHESRKDIAIETVKGCCPDGWTPDHYFGGQDSFFTRNCNHGEKEQWARCTIRRWVDKTTKISGE